MRSPSAAKWALGFTGLAISPLALTVVGVNAGDERTSNRGSSGRRRATRLLVMISELHKRGFQGLRIVPGMNEDPFFWSCHIVLGVDMDSRHGSYTQVVMGGSIPYDSGVGRFVWSDRRSTARELADEFERASFSDWLEAARIDDFAYAGWFLKMLGLAERGYFPAASPNDEIVSARDQVPLLPSGDGTVAPGRYTLPPAPPPPRRNDRGLSPGAYRL